MATNKQLLTIAVGTLILSATGFFGYRQLKPEPVDESGTARFLSLGTPRALELDSKKELKVLLSDPAIAKNWGLMGTNGESDVAAAKAWAVTQGSRDIVVAVIDTGIDSKHPDLRKNLWRNPGETGFDKNGRDKATNKLDDDGNGFVDDVHGWNFVGDNHDLADRHGHGTHIAGIVGAEGGNGVGISGVSPQVSLMVLKYYDPYAKANDNLKNTIRAIRYAIQKKAHIINYSGGGIEYSQEEREAVQAAKEAGILFVAAAGNEKSNSDQQKYFPADYPEDNIISVTAINPSAQVLPTSNYGEKTVHIAAPGEGIFSTLPDGKYGLMTGTSQATAFVSGVAALILAHNREFNYRKVRDQILKTSDQILGLQDKTATSGKLNSYKALVQLSENVTVSGVPTNASRVQAPVYNNGPAARPTENALQTATFILNALGRKPADKADADPATAN
ncbi:MAG TPA: S8 family peptidase [Bdellovibrionales bacterium]|nr:S8 family peptidase [Bdellovibrionales bacterium]